MPGMKGPPKGAYKIVDVHEPWANTIQHLGVDGKNE